MAVGPKLLNLSEPFYKYYKNLKYYNINKITNSSQFARKYNNILNKFERLYFLLLKIVIKGDY